MCLALKGYSIIRSSRGFNKPKLPKGKYYLYLQTDNLTQRLKFYYYISSATRAIALYTRRIC